jgi:hypothetical protein
MPIVRIPVPPNPRPETLTYAAARSVLARFVDDLALAERTLAAVGQGPIDLPLDLARVRLDLDGDGSGSEAERLWLIFARVSGLRDGSVAASVPVDFDQSDVVWLQGYCHLLMAIAELMLGYDWQAAFEVLFPGIFPMPSASHAKLQEFRRLAPDAARETFERFRFRSDIAGIADWIAFVHLARWPLVEPERVRSIGTHFQAMVRLSRENWRRNLAETDARAEWMPAPNQRGAIAGVQITMEQIQGWTLFLDEFDAVLNGRKLIPHWRFEEGVNVRRMFDQPPPMLDLVLLVQGAAVLPYLDKGELAGGEAWLRIQRLLGGDFFRYVVWFN